MPNYHFTVDMTNQAINWVKAQQSMTPDKPFFVYFATGAIMRPITCRRSGPTSTRGSSTRAGIRPRETLEGRRSSA